MLEARLFAPTMAWLPAALGTRASVPEFSTMLPAPNEVLPVVAVVLGQSAKKQETA